MRLLYPMSVLVGLGLASGVTSPTAHAGDWSFGLSIGAPIVAPPPVFLSPPPEYVRPPPPVYYVRPSYVPGYYPSPGYYYTPRRYYPSPGYRYPDGYYHHEREWHHNHDDDE